MCSFQLKLWKLICLTDNKTLEAVDIIGYQEATKIIVINGTQSTVNI